MYVNIAKVVQIAQIPQTTFNPSAVVCNVHFVPRMIFLSSILFEAGFCYVYVAQVVFNLQSFCLSFLRVRITGVHPIPAFIHSFSQSSHSSLVYIPFQGRVSRPSLIGEGWWRHFAG